VHLKYSSTNKPEKSPFGLNCVGAAYNLNNIIIKNRHQFNKSQTFFACAFPSVFNGLIVHFQDIKSIIAEKLIHDKVSLAKTLSNYFILMVDI
jgi:hypothetical protein